MNEKTTSIAERLCNTLNGRNIMQSSYTPGDDIPDDVMDVFPGLELEPVDDELYLDETDGSPRR